MLSGSPWGPLGLSSFPLSLSCSSSSVPSFLLGLPSDPPLGGLVLHGGPLGHLVHARQEVCLGLRVRWVIGKGVRWVPCCGLEFETLCARFGD
jgi:hypothetical protein